MCFDEIGIDTFCAVICHIFTRLRSSPFGDRLIYQSSCSLSLSVSHIDSSGVTDEDMRTPEIGQSPEACRSLHYLPFVFLSCSSVSDCISNTNSSPSWLYENKITAWPPALTDVLLSQTSVAFLVNKKKLQKKYIEGNEKTAFFPLCSDPETWS